MPIYEYQCDECGNREEVIQRLSDAPLTECSECGGPLRRLISAPAVQFKGSGWYVTDYAGRKSSDDGGDSSSEKTESATKSEGKAAAESSKESAKKAAGSSASAGSSPSD